MGKDANAIKQEIAQTRERMGDTVEALGSKADVGSRVKLGAQNQIDSVKGKIGNVVESVKGAVNGAQQSSGGNSTATKISDKISEFNEGVGSKMADADINGKTQRALGIATENPIGLTLAALAIGYLVGSLVPVSDVERERLGPIREKVVSQAQAATHDFVEAGKAVVAETAQTVVTTALSSAQSHGHEVLEAAKSRADQS